MKIRLLAILFFVALTVASVQSNDYQLQAVPKSVLAKIDPWVLDETAAKGQAEFLVVLADQADFSGAERLRTKEEKGSYVYRTLYDKAQATQKPLLNWLKTNSIEHRSFYIVNMILVKGNLDVALTLAARPDVGRIAGNPVIHNKLPQPSLSPGKDVPADPEAISSGVSYSRAPQVWAAGYNGQGMVVGGEDTGYQWDHPALKPHYRGWNGTSANHDYNWHDSIHSSFGPCVGNSQQPCDDNSHGSHTIGTAIGDDGSTNQIGMAPGAKWIGCRNMDQGNGTPATYSECFEFFIAPYPVNGTPAQGDPTKAPDVTTHSWGCPPSEGCTPTTWLTIQMAIQANRSAGIVTVVAAGNSGSGCSTVFDPPSFFPEVLTVGALNSGSDIIAGFSSRGPATIDGSNRQKPDITAPGTSIRSSVPVNSYSSSFSGTSMATPHVAGAVVLTLSAQPSLRGKVSTIEDILKDSAVHLNSALCSSSGSWPNNVFGYGRMDAKAAADMALTTFSPQSSAFTATGNEGSLNISAPAGANWTASSNDTWITIVNGGGAGNGTVDFIVRDNPNAQGRIGTITWTLTVAHRDFIVRQEGFGQSGCSYALTPAFQTFSAAGGTGNTTVVTAADCIWTATSNVPWITITSDNGGLGTGPLTFTVGVNSSGSARKGTINISGATFSVKQK